ncbi:MAG: hypothetical protein EOM21_19995 [Gammaproteobacteria bacterium]|nr:hypothetical protein [Gammaproteobacteria bacterium]
MFLYHDKSKIPGDKVKSAIFRADMAPIPETLEIDLRMDHTNRHFLKEGLDIYIGGGNVYRIALAELTRRNAEQARRLLESMHLTCVLRDLHKLTFVRDRAVYLEDTSLTEIYRACGATMMRPIQNDIRVPIFHCIIGDTPTFGIAKLFQEHGGVLRMDRRDRLEFIRLEEIFKQKPSLVVPPNVTEEIKSGFIERHEIPWFLSIGEDNEFILGDNSKPRHARYQHHATEDVVRNMTRVLVQAKRLRIDIAPTLRAGDAVEVTGVDTYAILTCANVYTTGTSGDNIEQYTRVWLGSLTSRSRALPIPI